MKAITLRSVSISTAAVRSSRIVCWKGSAHLDHEVSLAVRRSGCARPSARSPVARPPRRRHGLTRGLGSGHGRCTRERSAPRRLPTQRGEARLLGALPGLAWRPVFRTPQRKGPLARQREPEGPDGRRLGDCTAFGPALSDAEGPGRRGVPEGGPYAATGCRAVRAATLARRRLTRPFCCLQPGPSDPGVRARPLAPATSTTVAVAAPSCR